MVFVWPFMAIIAAAVFGTALLAAARVLGRLLLSVSLAMLIGIAFAIGLGDNLGPALAVLLTLALIAPIFWLLTWRAHARPNFAARLDTAQLTKVRSAEHRHWFRRDRRAQTELAWDRLAAAAPEHGARIQIARRSCERFSTHCAQRPFDLDAHRSRLIVGKRLRDLINQELDRAEQVDPRSQATRVEELIDLVERLAADCEREQARNLEIQAEDELLLRRHIENYLNRDAATPLKP